MPKVICRGVMNAFIAFNFILFSDFILPFFVPFNHFL